LLEEEAKFKKKFLDQVNIRIEIVIQELTQNGFRSECVAILRMM